MAHNARRLGERGGWGALRPELPQLVKGSRKLLVSTPTAISLSRLLCAVCPDVVSFVYSHIRLVKSKKVGGNENSIAILSQ